ncbi:low temperature requirement protein A [Sinorhizobium prairiense]|uniref:low temperature requirement protein A n=1 Tax=unclassified Sinorhizobium TaxID=2613772 RepID=UPI0023D8BF76|nr:MULTISPECIES: low temperature requirement protein A [unclassified Sinorhizobium]WEJ12957.1 low temperature requirement protein A [Sinorhizobium sp. M103]WEJ18041.1 low temperature requirement protein A [Sinorhizobium sp. K101]WEJ40009.1 low temperature requirement protein A [Sinorhizobium sp. C101]
MAENKTHWLRKENTDQTKASFPELFFDLVFVFALIQLSESLSDDFSLGIAAEAVLFIFALWWVWIHTTWVMDLLDTEISPVRLLLFTLMFCGMVMAIALPEALADMGLVFAVAYSAMQVSRSLFALYAFRRGDPASFMTFFRITVWLFISSVFWITGGLSEPNLRVVLWIVALALEYAGPMVRYWVPRLGASPRETLDIDGEHLAERSALFVIIALGETILTIGKHTFENLDTEGTPLVLCLSFLTTVLMWWIYFHDGQERAADKAEDTSKPQTTAQYLFTYGHLPIVGGIIFTAVAEDFSLAHPYQSGTYNSALAQLGGPILFLAGTMWMKGVSSRVLPYSHAFGIGLLAASFTLVPFIANSAIQALSGAILLVVAVWEYVALKHLRRSAA